MALVSIRAIIEKNKLFGRALVRITTKIEKIILFGRVLVSLFDLYVIT